MSVSSRHDEDLQAQGGWRRHDWLWMGVLLLSAALLRLPALDTAPPGFQFDETYNALDALRVVEGARPIFLPANGGREPLYTYWQAVIVALCGPTPTALRLASAVPGIATVVLLYGFVRILFPREGRDLAGLTALCLALSYWHLHFSRYAIRSILIPFWGLPTFAALWLGIRGKDGGWFVACGIGLAAMVWSHPLGRLMPIIVVFVVLYVALADRQHARRYILGALAAGMVALLLCLPLVLYFWEHPSQLLSHASDVSVFHPRVHQGNIPKALALNILRVAGMFTWRGDSEWLHNLPGRPAFDPLLSVGFLVGLVTLGQRLLRREVEPLDRGPYLLLGVWLIILLVPSTLSDMAPNFSRTIGAAPVAMLAAAWGLKRCGGWLESRSRPRLARCLIVVTMAISGGWACWDYFARFAPNPMAYYHYDQDKVDVAAFLQQESEENTLYLAPLWAHHPTVSLLTRDIDIRSVDTNAAIVFPLREGGKGVLYAFPPEQEADAARVEAEWGEWGKGNVVYDPQGRVLLHLFHISADHRPLMGEGSAFVAGAGFAPGTLEGNQVQFGPSIRLLGYNVSTDPSDRPELQITMAWEALGTTDRDYTAFVHLTDEHRQRWGQVDNWPGRGSYPTSGWQTGDVIVDRYTMPVDPCLSLGRHWLEVGWYDLTTGERLRTPGGGLSARLGTVDIASAPSVKRAELSPANGVDYWPSDAVHVFGFDLPETVLEVGRPFPLTLYWEASGQIGEPEAVLLLLEDYDGLVPGHGVQLASLEMGRRGDSVPGPSRAASPGQVWCQALRLRVESAPGGNYQLRLRAAARPERAADLAEVQVVPTTRRYTAPPLAVSVQQDLGDSIRLLGCDLSGTRIAPDGSATVSADGVLYLTLYWQLLRPVDTGYTVFTHLLDEAGELRGQKDGVPVQGTYPTTEWAEGEIVEDAYEIALAVDVAPGSYQLAVGLYDAATGHRVPLTREGRETGEDRVMLPIKVFVPKGGDQWN